MNTIASGYELGQVYPMRPRTSLGLRVLNLSLICIAVVGLVTWIVEPAHTFELSGLRVYADMRQTGAAVGPLKPGKMSSGEFAIALPLPKSFSLRDNFALSSQPNWLSPVRIDGVRTSESIALRVGEIDAKDIRIYQKTDRAWNRINPDRKGSFLLKSGNDAVIELGLGVALPRAEHANDQQNWPTEFHIAVGDPAADSSVVRVPFRVAPFILPNALDPADEILIADRPSTRAAVAALTPLAQKLGVKLTAFAGDKADVWMQDTIEFGQYAFPAHSGPQQVTAVLTGLRKEFGFGADALDAQMQKVLQERNIVTVEAGMPRKQTRWIDWFGNLEVTPPLTDRKNQSFPYGRILTGKQDSLEMHPGVMKFLESQRMQWPPIVVDTSWLMIGHVDEVVNFVPAKNRAGFRVLLPSPKAARDVLDDAVRNGRGDLAVFAGTRRETSVAKLRDSIAGSAENAKIDRIIAGVQDQLKSELNLGDDDFVHVPVLFDRGGAAIPNAVNSLIVNGHVFAPDPRGPRHEAKDLFAEAIRTAMSGCDVQVSFVDVWDAYHSRGGELHCGTNAIRRLRDPAWWKHGPAH